MFSAVKANPNHVPRRDRDIARGRLAADRARESAIAGGRGGKAASMEAALEHIAVSFDSRFSQPNSMKLRVETVLRWGAEHPETRARYGQRALMLAAAGCDLAGAIRTVETWFFVERTACALTVSGNNYRRTRLSLMTLAEMRLALRWLRRYRAAKFSGVIAALTSVDQLETEAAE